MNVRSGSGVDLNISLKKGPLCDSKQTEINVHQDFYS